MKSVDLNLVNFSQQGFRSSYMSAKSESMFDTGEPTSDYLGFFGFGSGRVQGPSYPAMLDNYVNFEFKLDTESKSMDVITPIFQKYVKVLKVLSSIDIKPEESAVKEFLENICRVSEPRVLSSADYLTGVALNSIFDTRFDTTPSLNTFALKNGQPYFSFGVFAQDKEMKEHIFNAFKDYDGTIWSGRGLPGFNWDYYTQLGSYDHASSLLKTMNRHEFVEDWDKCDEVLKKTIANIDKFYLKS